MSTWLTFMVLVAAQDEAPHEVPASQPMEAPASQPEAAPLDAQPAPAPHQEVRVEKGTSRPWGRLVLAAAAGAGTALAMTVPPLLAAGVAGVAWNAASGWATQESLAAGLVMFLFTPVWNGLLAVPGLAVAGVLGGTVTWLLAGRKPLAWVSVPVTLALSAAGSLLGAVIHFAGAVVGCGLGVVVWIAASIIILLLGAFCAALCGTTSSPRSPSPESIHADRELATRFMAGMAAWTFTCLVPSAAGAIIGAIAGPTTGAALGAVDRIDDEDADATSAE